MNEAEKTFDTIRRAVAFSEPDCGWRFETRTVENETEYRIWGGAGNRLMTWTSDDVFLNGRYDTCSIRDTARNIVEICNDGLSGWRSFQRRYPGIIDVFRAVSESSSPEELRLRLTASGLL